MKKMIKCLPQRQQQTQRQQDKLSRVRAKSFTLLALVASILILIDKPVLADMVDVDATQVGGFFAVGTPDNDASFQNYFIGHGTIPGLGITPERRSFFLFDIPTLGIGESYTDATFSIYLPAFSIVANFSGGIEAFLITSTPFSATDILDPPGAGLAAEEIFDSFGMGDFYGDLIIPFSPPPPGPFPMELIIPLSPDALSDINGAAGGTFVISGRMETYDPAPGAPDELMFGLSDLVSGGVPTGLPSPFLTLTTTSAIPEPSGVALILLAGLTIAVRRRR